MDRVRVYTHVHTHKHPHTHTHTQHIHTHVHTQAQTQKYKQHLLLQFITQLLGCHVQHILTQALIHQSSYPCQCHLMVVPGLVYICVCMCVYGVCDFQLQYVCVSCAAHPHASLGPSQQGPVPTQAHVHPLIYAHTDTHLTTWSSVTASMCAK